jgi:hypothetical protein
LYIVKESAEPVWIIIAKGLKEKIKRNEQRQDKVNEEEVIDELESQGSLKR